MRQTRQHASMKAKQPAETNLPQLEEAELEQEAQHLVARQVALLSASKHTGMCGCNAETLVKLGWQRSEQMRAATNAKDLNLSLEAREATKREPNQRALPQATRMTLSKRARADGRMSHSECSEEGSQHSIDE